MSFKNHERILNVITKYTPTESKSGRRRNINNHLCDLEQACEHPYDHARLLNPFASMWAPLWPCKTMKLIWHRSYSVNLTVFGTERTSWYIWICKHWCHFDWKYMLYGNRHITFMGSVQGLYTEPKHTRPTHYIYWQYTLTVYGDQRTQDFI